jgi:hypothetical protein
MTILTYIGVSLVILVLCGLGLSIGLLFNRRGLTKCGQGEGAITPTRTSPARPAKIAVRAKNSEVGPGLDLVQAKVTRPRVLFSRRGAETQSFWGRRLHEDLERGACNSERKFPPATLREARLLGRGSVQGVDSTALRRAATNLRATPGEAFLMASWLAVFTACPPASPMPSSTARTLPSLTLHQARGDFGAGADDVHPIG